VIHRADYLDVLHEAAIAAGAELRLGADVDHVDFERTEIRLKTGELINADIIVGADGLWSTSRDLLLGSPSPPTETGDLAYRGTFTRAQLDALHDPEVTALCSKKAVTVWLGPSKHAVFYPLKGGQQFNLVLLRPDDMPTGSRQAQGEVEEMRTTFEGWDGRLQKIISCLSTALKWKLCHHEELPTWTKVRVNSLNL
jgi:salicylate hydroxylase